MDLKGSLFDTKLKIYPSNNFIKFIQNISVSSGTPENIIKLAGCKIQKQKKDLEAKSTKISDIYLDSIEKEQIINICKYLEDDISISNLKSEKNGEVNNSNGVGGKKDSLNNHSAVKDAVCNETHAKNKSDLNHEEKSETTETDEKTKYFENRQYLTTLDIDWLYDYISKQKSAGRKDIPYLHNLLEESIVKTPDNTKIKRNPELEARCVKLRSQQEAREYRKMTRSVDNVRMRYPEDSIAYQLKSLNRQMIAIGQFILSILSGFLFGFLGIELMIGGLDFGFRLLLGVMCALIIALAEIYFLAKKLNEELQLTETVQIGGPPKFADSLISGSPQEPSEKEHQD